MSSTYTGNNGENQGPRLAWSKPRIEEVPIDDYYRALYQQALEEEPDHPWEWPPEITAHMEETAARLAAATKPPVPDYVPPGVAAGMPPMFSEDHLALKLVEQHGASLRYVAIWGKWLSFTAGRWAHENTLAVWDKARKICRAAAIEMNKLTNKPSNTLSKSKTAAAVETMARSDRAVAATSDQWDANPWMLNAPGGIIDLRKAWQVPHAARDYATKIVAADPRPCKCPLFSKFLMDIFKADLELIEYIQKVFGYALTGDTREHALFFFYGTGSNGKSVLVRTMAGILGDYHKTAPIETFTASIIGSHPTDLAMLRGARLVTAVETEEGRRWAESKIKSLTGGDEISARFMRQDFFSFTPQFKLIIAGNHKPGLRSVDEAIRRRFHLVPFAVTFPEKAQDKELANKLRAEWPGILQWAIEGCLKWQDQGLSQPKAVRDATAAYLEAEDATTAWIDDRCDLGPNHWEATAKLFASWKAWAELAGEFVGSQKQFGEKLETRGLTYARVGHDKVRAYRGIRLKEFWE